MSNTRTNTKRPAIMSGPPPLGSKRSRESFYRDLFEEMEIGQWIEIPLEDRCKYQNAASKYMRGRHSLRKHAYKRDVFVFLKTR